MDWNTNATSPPKLSFKTRDMINTLITSPRQNTITPDTPDTTHTHTRLNSTNRDIEHDIVNRGAAGLSKCI